MLKVVVDQGCGRRILACQNLAVSFDSRHQIERQLLAEFDAPLVEGIYTPHDTLHKGDVLIEGNQLAQHPRGQARSHNRGRRTVAAEDTGVYHVLGGTFGTYLILGLAESERLSLCKEVCEEEFVHILLAILGGVHRVGEGQEVRRDKAGAWWISW